MDPITPVLPEPDGLDRLVTVVAAAAAAEGWHGPHRLLRAEEGEAGEWVLASAELEDDSHPVTDLLGFVAPPSWVALGLLSYGWGAPEEAAGGPRPSRHPERRRVRIVSMVDRAGRMAATAAFDDGTVIDEAPEGLLPDVLRRCLGAPTAPPPAFAVLVDTLWVQSVLAVAKRRQRLTWTRVVELRGGERGPSSWTDARATAAMTTPFWGDLAPWMDDGMFARWLLADLPPLDQLLRDADRRLPKDLARRLRAAVIAP